MNVRNVQRLVKDPYIHDTTNQEAFLGSSGTETGDQAVKLLTQAKRVYNLRHENAGWVLYKNDGSIGVSISGAHYTPDFRVRAIKLFSGTNNSFMRIVYDVPQSTLAQDTMATGVLHPLWITRLHTGSRYFDSLDGYEISIFG